MSDRQEEDEDEERTRYDFLDDFTITFSGYEGDGYAEYEVEKSLVSKDLTFTVDPVEGLSNGDSVTVTISYNKQLMKDRGYRIKRDSYTYIVEGLAEYTDIDPFTALKLETKGFNGYGHASLDTSGLPDAVVSGVRFEMDRNSGLSNGENISVTAAERDSLKEAGYRLTRDSGTLKVEGLNALISLDPFKFLKVTFENPSPLVTVKLDTSACPSEVKDNVQFKTDRPSYGYADGETAVVTASLNDWVTEQYGYYIPDGKSTKEYKVENVSVLLDADTLPKKIHRSGMKNNIKWLVDNTGKVGERYFCEYDCWDLVRNEKGAKSDSTYVEAIRSIRQGTIVVYQGDRNGKDWGWNASNYALDGIESCYNWVLIPLTYTLRIRSGNMEFERNLYVCYTLGNLIWDGARYDWIYWVRTSTASEADAVSRGMNAGYDTLQSSNYIQGFVDTDFYSFEDKTLDDLSSSPEDMITASKGTPAVDGVKDDIWDRAESRTQKLVRTGEDTGVHAEFRFLYDNDNLYFLAEVPDGTLWSRNDTDPTYTYDVDSAELCLSLIRSTENWISETTDAWIGVTPYGNIYPSQIDWMKGSRPGVSQSTGLLDAEFMELHTSLENDPSNTSAKSFIIEAVWHIRAYNALYAPKPGRTYGFEMSYNDNAKNTGRTMCIGWADDSDTAYANPSVWGTIVLGDS